jgi:hypothetical protein
MKELELSTGLLVEWWVWRRRRHVLRVVVLEARRAGEDGGVKVERPQPKARTYDLDASVGRRTLVDDDIVAVGCSTGSVPVFASGPSRVEVAEVWQVGLPRHLFVPSAVAGRMMRSWPRPRGAQSDQRRRNVCWRHAARRARRRDRVRTCHAASWVRQRISPSRSP